MIDMRAKDARGVVEKARVEGRTWREARRVVNIVDGGAEAFGCRMGVRCW
jgi:hypothetical protein